MTDNENGKSLEKMDNGNDIQWGMAYNGGWTDNSKW